MTGTVILHFQRVSRRGQRYDEYKLELLRKARRNVYIFELKFDCSKRLQTVITIEIARR